MINLIIDDKPISVPKGTTVYHAAKQLGVILPIFCYQDRMPPFGACRVCLVEVEKMGKLQTSCTLEATEGMVVRTTSDPAVTGRKSVLEFLLINHPLDCPICDKGGECPLQDQTLAHGPGESRFFEEKRHFKKAYPLGPILMLDRERCIACARCVRFGDIVAGDHALEFIERGYKTEVGTLNGQPVKSKFIGNTIDICPVGALTSQAYRFKARPWDNRSTESTCTLCPVGCSMKMDERDDDIVRIRAVENRGINDMWLCDKGWFGFEFNSHQDRLNTPLIRKNGVLVEASWDETFSLIAQKFKEGRESKKIAALGGNVLTVEENYLFQKLIREGAFVNNVDHRIDGPLFSHGEDPVCIEMPISAYNSLSLALLVGVDLTEEFPLVWLRLKSAIDHGTKAVYFGHYALEIAPKLHATHLYPAGDELSSLLQVRKVIEEHVASKGPKPCAIFLGRQYLHSLNRGQVLEEVAKIQQKYPFVTLNLMQASGNSEGARFAGMRPDVGPKGQVLSQPGFNRDEIIEQTLSNGWDFLYLVGANLAAKCTSEVWKKLRSHLKFLVVQDLFLTETAKDADVVLPTLSYLEKTGSFVNFEGNVLPIKELAAKKDLANRYSDGEIFGLLATRLGLLLKIDDEFKEALKSQKLPKISLSSSNKDVKQSEVKEGGLAIVFTKHLFDQGVRMCHNKHLSQVVKEPLACLHPEDIEKYHLKNDAFATISTKHGAIEIKIQAKKDLARGTLLLPLGYDQYRMSVLSPALLNGTSVENIVGKQ